MTRAELKAPDGGLVVRTPSMGDAERAACFSYSPGHIFPIPASIGDSAIQPSAISIENDRIWANRLRTALLVVPKGSAPLSNAGRTVPIMF